jgi:hypothetical protein
MAEKNLFFYIFLRLGLEPYNICTIQKLPRRHSKVVFGGCDLQLPPKQRARGIIADAVPIRFLTDPERVAGSGSMIRIRIAVLFRWG